jgi:hypothetical protein
MMNEPIKCIVLLVIMFKIARRCSGNFITNSCIKSKRPDRKKHGSMECKRLVIANCKIFSQSSSYGQHDVYILPITYT